MKFCAHCGSQMADEDRVCGNCGIPAGKVGPAPVNPGAAPNVGYQAAPTAKANAGGFVAILKKYKFILIAAVVAIVAIVAVLVVVNTNSGYKGTLKKMFAALEDCGSKSGVEDAVDISLDIQSIGCMRDESLSWVTDYNERCIKDAYDMMEDAVGDVKDISFEITDEEKFSERELDSLKADLEQRYHTFCEEMTEAVTLTVKVYVTGDSKKTFRTSIVMIKEAGEWKIFSYTR